jgi:hypothetical protein
MTVRQLKSSDQAPHGSTMPAPQVIVHIKTTRQLIGETWYAPEVKVTNSSKAPITITDVKLAARSKTYTNMPSRPEIYPLTIQPGGTETLDVMFRLDAAVYKTFQQSAELLVQYRSEGTQGIAHASVIGGRLEEAP